MATGRDPQSFVLDHLEFVQMGWGHLGEPNGSGIIEDGVHDGPVGGHQSFGRENRSSTQLGLSWRWEPPRPAQHSC